MWQAMFDIFECMNNIFMKFLPACIYNLHALSLLVLIRERCSNHCWFLLSVLAHSAAQHIVIKTLIPHIPVLSAKLSRPCCDASCNYDSFMIYMPSTFSLRHLKLISPPTFNRSFQNVLSSQSETGDFSICYLFTV